MTLTFGQLARIGYLLYQCEGMSLAESAIEQMESSEELHTCAVNFNWDNGYRCLQAVLAHPSCDRGTALLLYWWADPMYLEDLAAESHVPEANRDTYRFLKHVESLLMKDTFRSNNIRFDPTAELNVVQRRRTRDAQAIPEELKAPNC